jgi:hypothetical protein
MRTVIVYESMFGNTRLIAEAIARGMGPGDRVEVRPVAGADRELVAGADLVVVGGPTHMHSMSRASSRKSAAASAAKPGHDLTLEPGAEGPGVREWLGSLGQVSGRAAAFDTRLSGLPMLTGQASKGIGKQLRQHGFTLVADPESFLVTGDSKLRPGEQERAAKWGAWLAASQQAAAQPA